MLGPVLPQGGAPDPELHYCVLALIGLLTTALGWIMGRSRSSNGKGGT